MYAQKCFTDRKIWRKILETPDVTVHCVMPKTSLGNHSLGKYLGWQGLCPQIKIQLS